MKKLSLAMIVLCMLTLLSKPPVKTPVACITPAAIDSVQLFGKLLFNDARISSSGKISCANCHKENFCFADSVRFNTGNNGKLLSENTISLLHLNTKNE